MLSEGLRTIREGFRSSETGTFRIIFTKLQSNVNGGASASIKSGNKRLVSIEVLPVCTSISVNSFVVIIWSALFRTVAVSISADWSVRGKVYILICEGLVCILSVISRVSVWRDFTQPTPFFASKVLLPPVYFSSICVASTGSFSVMCSETTATV